MVECTKPDILKLKHISSILWTLQVTEDHLLKKEEQIDLKGRNCIKSKIFNVILKQTGLSRLQISYILEVYNAYMI